MKIENKTHWRTDQMKKIISRIAKDELESLTAWRKKKLVIEIVYTRPGQYRNNKDYTTGCAYVGGSWMTIRVGKESFNRVSFATTTAHEFAHIRGLRHNRINGRRAYDHRCAGNKEVYAWTADYPVELKEIKAKPKADVQIIRFERTNAAIARWEAKLKRATNALKKLRVTRRYYERALAAKKVPVEVKQ